MRRYAYSSLTIALLLPLAGCNPQYAAPDEGLLGAAAVVADGGDANSAAVPAAKSVAGRTATSISGSVLGSGNYQLYDLGAAVVGDEWSVALTSASASDAFIAVLLDADNDLLMRTRISAHAPLQHIVRRDTPHLFLGVTPTAGSGGGDFRYTVSLEPGVAVPPPMTQTVYLNFAGGQGVYVQSRGPISFGVFDAAVLGAIYSGQTQQVKDVIVATMRERYALYEVEFLTSDDGPPPADGQYSAVHFGGYDNVLLGLADGVDMYNEVPAQDAIIYVERFAPYQVMELTTEEIGVMIGNVASHELGHLLGLYHTSSADEVMDLSPSAWDLAGPQAFARAALERTVFPTGTENTPRLLEETVGLRPEPAVAKPTTLLSIARPRRPGIINLLPEERLDY
jgi:hypothetical protein